MLGSQVSTYGFIKIDKIWQGQRSFDFRGKLMITITAYNWVPDFAKGLVRDLRVRWALEEAGLPYQVKLIPHEEKLTPSYRVLQPFSQVPSYRDDDVVLFESGAIILHIASTSDALLPTDHVGRARATAWVFAALNSVEPFIMGLVDVDIFSREAPWAKESRPHKEAMVKKRLSDLAERLGGRDWLEDRFTAGDLMMATVLRILRQTDLVTSDPTLAPYLVRCEARPAFQKALADQMASFLEADARPAA
jgi:glutathione S-transferase